MPRHATPSVPPRKAAVHRAIGLRPSAQRIAAAGGPTAAADVLEQLATTRE